MIFFILCFEISAQNKEKRLIPILAWLLLDEEAGDANTAELARTISENYFLEYGLYPHVIICLLHREKLDANREIEEAAESNPIAEQAWLEFHDFIEEAKPDVSEQLGSGLFIDLHEHGHDIDRLELGYVISGTQLRNNGQGVDSLDSLSSSSCMP